MHTVTMRNQTTDDSGTLWEFTAVDNVPSEALDAYVADARTRWDIVDVSENQEN